MSETKGISACDHMEAAARRTDPSTIGTLLSVPGTLWSVGTGAAMMACGAGEEIRPTDSGWSADGNGTRLRISGAARALAFETLSSDPFGWNQGVALCAAGEPTPQDGADGLLQMPGVTDDRVRLWFRPAGPDVPLLREDMCTVTAIAALRPCPGTWIVGTAIADIEIDVPAGHDCPVHILGASPGGRPTPLPEGWQALAHAFPPHAARSRPGQPAAFDRAHHDRFQGLLAVCGRPDLWRLKQAVLAALTAGEGPGDFGGDRHAEATVRVALRQWCHLSGEAPPDAWLARHDKPLLKALSVFK